MNSHQLCGAEVSPRPRKAVSAYTTQMTRTARPSIRESRPHSFLKLKGGFLGFGASSPSAGGSSLGSAKTGIHCQAHHITKAAAASGSR